MRELQPCGTYAAYRRHLRHGEVPCTPCTDANWRYGIRFYKYPPRRGPLAHRDRVLTGAEPDLREVIHLLALAFTTPPDGEAA